MGPEILLGDADIFDLGPHFVFHGSKKNVLSSFFPISFRKGRH